MSSFLVLCEGDTRNRWRDGQVCPDVRQGTMAPWARRLGEEKKSGENGRKEKTGDGTERERRRKKRRKRIGKRESGARLEWRKGLSPEIGEKKTMNADESRFCLQHHDGRIRVWRHRGECILTACIRLRNTGPSPDVMVWGAIEYTSQSPLVHIDGTLNSVRYISGVLRPLALRFIRALRNPTFQQDNARSHVTGIVRTFFDTENVQLFSLPARSPDLSPIKNVRSVVAE
ncbi:transposable element Tcb1 transposase [Trichonephila clavipes]|nr:transposable element Tcb1 transposase [Trichonephila clavipes]